MVTKNAILALLIAALLLSATATYLTITKFSEAQLTKQEGEPITVGVHVPPARPVNVGVTVIPPEQKEEGK